MERSHETIDVYEASSQDSTDGTLERDFYSPINGIMGDNGQVEVFGADRHQPPVESLYVPEAQSSNLDASSRSRNVSSHSKTATATATSADSHRINRLEGVMEQLVLLNASQARREAVASVAQAASSDSRSQHSSASAVHEIADTLKQELVEIRGKMEERAREDEALRQEIGMLRDQLAERRSAGTGTGIGTTRRLAANNNQRPPPINTRFVKKNPIRGIFNSRNNNKKQGRQQHHVVDGVTNDNDPRVALQVMPFESDEDPNPPLGLDDEQSETRSSW